LKKEGGKNAVWKEIRKNFEKCKEKLPALFTKATNEDSVGHLSKTKAEVKAWLASNVRRVGK